MLFYGFARNEENLFIITEYLPCGTLAQLIEHTALDEATTIKFAFEIAAGMAHLHNNGIIHGDLAPRNLLVNFPKYHKQQLEI